MPEDNSSFRGGVAGPLIDTGVRAQSSGPGPFPFGPNGAPLGSATGGAPATTLRTYQVIPSALVGGSANQQATRIVMRSRENRVVVFTAPIVGFSIYIGDAGLTTQTGMALTPGIPYDVVLPPDQEIYALTDAPTYLPLRVQVSAILVADRERRM